MSYLRSKEVLKELSNRGIKISHKTLTRYVWSKIIPDEYVIVEKRGLRKYFYFKPEVVDYLEKKLSME